MKKEINDLQHMRGLMVIWVMILLIGCKNDTRKIDNNKQLVKNFLAQPNSIRITTHQNPIAEFNAISRKMAHDYAIMQKSTTDSLLKMSALYRHTVIVIEDHTILKLIEPDSCMPSNAWKACMPKGIGFKRTENKLVPQKGFLQYIIGNPDSKRRIIYFFK